MTQQEDLPGGLHFDGPRDVQVGPQTGIVRYYPVAPGTTPPENGSPVPPPAPERPRTRWWWHVFGVVLGPALVVAAAFAWGYGIDQFDELRWRGLVGLGLAGLLVGLMTLGRLSPSAPLVGGLAAVGASVVYELGYFPALPVLRPVLESGAPVAVGVLLLVVALRRR
ncbi:hypothetical protein ACQPW3_41675 [Actinosynnema sp. CA-248983]